MQEGVTHIINAMEYKIEIPTCLYKKIFSSHIALILFLDLDVGD